MALRSLLGEARARCGALLSLGVLSTISVLEICGGRRGSSSWQQLLLGARSPRTGMLRGARSCEATHAACVMMHLFEEGPSLLMAGGRQTAAGPAGEGEAGERAGGSSSPSESLPGTCFFLWLLRLHGVGGAYPLPTASPPRRE